MANKNRKPIGNFTKIFLLASIITVIVTPLYLKRQTIIQSDAARGSRFTITLLNENPVYKSLVSFFVSGTDFLTGQYWILNECTQNSTVVYQQYLKIQGDGYTGPFTLGPTPSWSEGGANCRASVMLYQKGRFRPQGSMSYTVAP